ncbi:MAG: antibiotic biosynthesis monooxygenase [Variovorax sp.]|nr:MAG: antibiotic biosynthesis monooxygenase [Variovorax sp.]
MHCILARITVKPETADLARGILIDLAAKSRKEAGCVSYEVYQQADAPDCFQTVEHWREKADADAHMASLHLGAAMAAAGPLLAAPPQILAYSRLM